MNCYWKGEEKREISWSKLDRDNKNISEMREQISAVFYNIVNNNKEKESPQSFEELMVTLPKEKEKDIAAIRKNIKNARNDLNHAGFRLGSRDEDTLKKELMRELEKFEKII